MDRAPMEAAPKLKGISPVFREYSNSLCPHGKPGNGWLCPEPGCSGQGLCEHGKQRKQTCKECMPAQCPLCNNGRIYAWHSLLSHIYNTKVHEDVPEDEKTTAYVTAGMREIEKGRKGYSFSSPEMRAWGRNAF